MSLNNLTDEEFFALYPQPYLQPYLKQPALFPFIQKPEPVKEEVKEEDRINRIMASLLKKAEQEENDDLDETLVWENEPDDELDEETFAQARLRLADLVRIARLEIEEAILNIPVLVRQTTGMVVDGKTVYNGCPSGARLLSNDGDYDLLFPVLDDDVTLL